MTHSWHRVAALLLAWLTLALGARSAEYWLGPEGVDTQDGSAARPWRTLAKANQVVKPGDTVKVLPGHYAGAYLTTNGTREAPIRYLATEKHQAIIDQGEIPKAQLGHRVLIGLRPNEAHFTHFVGFQVTGGTSGGIGVYRNTGVLIQDCDSHHNERWGIFTKEVKEITLMGNLCHDNRLEHGIYHADGATDSKLIGNHCYNNAGCGIQLNQGRVAPYKNVLIAGNLLENNNSRGGQSINLDGGTEVTLVNNVISVHRRSGIGFYQIDGATPAMNNVVAHNLFILHAGARGAWLFRECRDNVIFNNIVWTLQAGGRGFDTDAGGSIASAKVSHNAGNVAPMGEGWLPLTGALSEHLVAPDKGDYRLLPTSSLRDRGLATYAERAVPPLDRAGKPRPQGPAPDPGPYELPPKP